MTTPYARGLVRIFDYVSASETENGLEGWLMRGFEGLDPVSGFGVAHDALEHFDKKQGADAELIAFGAIAYGRVSHNYKNAQQNPDVFGDDLARFIADGMEWTTAIPAQKPLDDGAIELWIAAVGESMVKGYRDDMDGNPDTLAELPARWVDMANWIRKGYRQTAKRWDERGGPSAFMDMFEAISLSAGRIDMEFRPDRGDKLRVRIHGGERGVFIDYYSATYQEWSHGV